MKLVLQSGSLSGSDLFNLIWRGWFVGVTAMCLPLAVVVGLKLVISGESDQVPDQYLLAPVLIPVIAAGQGVIVGALVLFGLFVRPPRKSGSSPNVSDGSN